jgi:uncharacterized protein YdbL (DUF1318 family)
MRTVNRLASMVAAVAIAATGAAHAAPAKYWVLVATRDVNVSTQEKVEVFDRARACGYTPKMDLSEKFTGFVAGYGAFVVGPYDVKQDADFALGKLQPCFWDARVKFTEYHNDYMPAPRADRVPPPAERPQEKAGTFRDQKSPEEVSALKALVQCTESAIKAFYSQSEPATVVADAAMGWCGEEMNGYLASIGVAASGSVQAKEHLRPIVTARVMAYRAVAKFSEQTTPAPIRREYTQ